MSTAFHFRCPSCGADRVASKNIAGRQVRCPECSQVIRVPQPQNPAVASGSAAKAGDFDPYYQWLAIPPSEQPPNHYRLLGVSLFEPDENVIAVSADRQMVHVKAQSTGKYVKQSQKLLNELARARACLLDPKKRAEYDAQLRAEQRARARPAGIGAAQNLGPTGTKASSRPPAGARSSSLGRTPALGAPVETKPTRRPSARGPIRAGPVASAPTGAAPPSARARPASPPPGRRQRTALGAKGAPPGSAPPAVPWKTAARKPPSKDEEAELREPAVSFRTERDDSGAEMDMTPMVDVTFLLLIFFMVTAAFSLQRSMEMPTPKQDEPSQNVQTIEDFQDNPDFVVVHVDAYNTYHVSTTDWEEEAPSEHELLIRLRRARQGNREGKIPTRLLVTAHGDALYDKVIAAMDAGTSVRMEEIQVVMTEEDFE